MDEFDFVKHYSFRLPKDLMDEFKMEVELSTTSSSMTETLKSMIKNKISMLRGERNRRNTRREERMAEFEAIKSKKEAFLKARAEALAEKKKKKKKKKKDN